MELHFDGEVISWRGPAPFHFVAVPADVAAHLRAASSVVTYGWGMVPVTVRIGSTRWKTSLFPKDGRYLVPVKAHVRDAEGLEVGALVTVRLELGA